VKVVKRSNMTVGNAIPYKGRKRIRQYFRDVRQFVRKRINYSAKVKNFRVKIIFLL